MAVCAVVVAHACASDARHVAAGAVAVGCAVPRNTATLTNQAALLIETVSVTVAGTALFSFNYAALFFDTAPRLAALSRRAVAVEFTAGFSDLTLFLDAGAEAKCEEERDHLQCGVAEKREVASFSH